MIAHFDDFCLWVYVLVEDMCQVPEEHLRRPGPKPASSDSELGLMLDGACKKSPGEIALKFVMYQSNLPRGPTE